jgi:hypothetical protein
MKEVIAASALVGVAVVSASHPKVRRGCCQANANWSPKRPEPEISGRQLTPLGQNDRDFLLADAAAVEVAVLMEVVLDRA